MCLRGQASTLSTRRPDLWLPQVGRARSPQPPAEFDSLLMDVDNLGEIAATNEGILRRAHLDAFGLTPAGIRDLLAQGVLTRVQRDVYRPAAPNEHPLTDFHAAVRALRQRDPTRVLTGAAALSALGLPVFGRPATLHVAIDGRGGSSARSVTSTVAAPPEDQVTVVRGSLVACPARAVLDTARLQSVTAGVIAADEALRTGRASPDELSATLATMRGLPGVARARLCHHLASPLSESPGESWSVVVMHQHGIEAPERQAVFDDARGFVGRVDFWWPRTRLIGEFDGRVKYGRVNPSGRPPEDVLWDEKVREDRLRALDTGMIRWTTDDLRHPKTWIARLRSLAR